MKKWMLAGVLCGGVGGPLLAQGIEDYLNFEAPVHRGLAVTNITLADGDIDVLLACNPQDNSVEVWTATATPTFLLRVPVGQAPVTVVVKPTQLENGGRRCYTANWLGDSITRFDLLPSEAGAVIRARVEQSTWVGDEPVDIAFLPNTTTEPWSQPGQPLFEGLAIVKQTEQSWGLLDPITLQGAPVPGGGSYAMRELLDVNQQFAIKSPRAIAFDPTATDRARMVVANLRGGNTSVYDYDLWITDDILTSLSAETATRVPLGGMGSANYDVVFHSDGTLYVCGQFAQNMNVPTGQNFVNFIGEPHARGLVTGGTGFVTSALWRVTGLGGTLTVSPPLDLNLDPSTGMQATTAVTQPTAVLVYEDELPGGDRVFVTGFNSDTLGVVQHGTFQVGWRLDLSAPTPFPDPAFMGDMRGPRSLALLNRPGTQDDLLFVYNRVEHSITVVDPAFTTPSSAVLGTVAMNRNPEPFYIRDGRKFLYSSKLSGGDNVSCASCHLDGDNDNLAWNLSDNVAVPQTGLGKLGVLGPNPAIKGPMMTQTLRGLVNHEIEDDFLQDVVYSNRAYHWRGDRGLFEQFNAAFDNLMAINNPVQPGEKGISDDAMRRYRDFTFSMHYPPNPDQPWQRRYSGSVYANPASPNPADKNDLTVGTGAQRGLKLFHIQNQDGSSCATCHSLGEGSNNTLTELAFNPFPGMLQGQRIETAQLRGLVRRDKRLVRYDGTSAFRFIPSGNGAVTGEFGLTHTGYVPNPPAIGDFTLSINAFVNGFLPGPEVLGQQDLDDIAAYVREFDTGVAPLVGFTTTISFAAYNANQATFQNGLTGYQGQAEDANASVVIHARINGQLHGFYYDVTDAATPYHEVAATPTIGNLSQSQLFAFLDSAAPESNPDNALMIHVTPLGSERRVANVEDGSSGGLSTSAPSNVALLPAIANTANRVIPGMTRQFLNAFGVVFGRGIPSAANNFLDFNEVGADNIFQDSLLRYAGASGVGWEPPRRFRFDGDGIAHGAWARIFSANAADIASSPAGQPPLASRVPAKATNLVIYEGPIYAARDSGGQVVWESSAEVASATMMGFLNGGLHNAPVPSTLVSFFNAVLLGYPNNIYDPTSTNFYRVEIQNDRNDPSTYTMGAWQPLAIQ